MIKFNTIRGGLCPSLTYLVLFFFLLVTGLTAGAQKEDSLTTVLSLELGADFVGFPKKGEYADQNRLYPGLSARPSVELKWGKNHRFNAEAFGRIDLNGNARTHVDLREAYYQTYKGGWEFNIGNRIIYWGKTEAVHLVNVINQIDLLEGVDGEERLGQPMVHVVYSSGIGTFEWFALPYTRELEFGNAALRPRFPVVIDDTRTRFESSQDAWHPTTALRYSNFFGDVDLGIHYFYGNARDPLVEFSSEGIGLVYPIVHQVGIDYQHIVGAVALKAESIYRANKIDDVFSITGGFEYTFGNVKSTGLDIGILTEYVFDSRREELFSSLDNDLFFGTRLAFNDVKSTEILLGMFQDVSRSTRMGRIEANRRLGNAEKLTLTGQLYWDVDQAELAYFFRSDSFLSLEWIHYF